MATYTIKEQNEVLDHIIESRHTVRKFKNEAPPRTMIEMVLQSGLLAPYGMIAVNRGDFRRFVVLPRESDVTAQAALLIKQKAAAIYNDLKNEIEEKDILSGPGSRYYGLLKMIGQQGLPSLGKVPYYIVVAEQKGTPDVVNQSMAHCLQNMWLKATALGLGFQLLSVTERMAEEREFCELIGIPFGEYALDGCLIGYPDDSPGPKSKRPSLNEVTTWL
jgi:nitroreductase